MLVFRHLPIFFLIVGAIFGIVSSERIRRLNQIIAEIGIGLFIHVAVFGFKFAGLFARPNESRHLRDFRLGGKAVNVADFREDAGGIDEADASHTGQRCGEAGKFFRNGGIQSFQRRRQRAEVRQRETEHVLDTLGHPGRQAIGGPGQALQFRDNLVWLREAVVAPDDDEAQQVFGGGRGNGVRGHEFLNDGHGRGPKDIGERLPFFQCGKLEEQMGEKVTFLPRDLLHQVMPKARQTLQGQRCLMRPIGDRLRQATAEVPPPCRIW